MYVVAEDIEAGIRTKTKFQTEPTLPIYLKVINNIYTHFTCHKVLSFFFSSNILATSSARDQ
jgi:hypothetical protein